jgi:hypothetical protein
LKEFIQLSYQDRWYVEKRIALQRLWGAVTLKDAEAARDGLERFLQEGTPLIHFLVDLYDIEQFPAHLASLRRITPNLNSPGLGWLVIYGTGNPLMRFVASTLTQVALPKLRLRMFGTLEESLVFLQGQDSTLGNLTAVSDSL